MKIYNVNIKKFTSVHRYVVKGGMILDKGFYIYLLVDSNDNIVYVGQTKYLLSRLYSHVDSDRDFETIYFKENKKWSKDIEAYLIFKWEPKYNLRIPLNKRFFNLHNIFNGHCQMFSNFKTKSFNGVRYFDIKDLIK